MQQVKELPACPVETTLMLIGDKWKVLILRDLMPGTKRFGELKKSIGHGAKTIKHKICEKIPGQPFPRLPRHLFVC